MNDSKQLFFVLIASLKRPILFLTLGMVTALMTSCEGSRPERLSSDQTVSGARTENELQMVEEAPVAVSPAQPQQAASSKIAADSDGRSVILAPREREEREIPAPDDTSEDFNTEEYDRIYENPFLAVGQNPLSTFSIDVDTASYSNTRRFLSQNQLPPADAVRLEELINYFDYDYPQPTGADPFSVTTELARAPWNPDHEFLMVGIQGQDLATEELPPNNLVFLLDVSGSMNEPNKLPLLKNAMKLLVEQLDRGDRVSIVVYAGAAGLVLEPTPGDKADQILAAINALEAGGSTAGGEGIELAYQVAKETFLANGNNRVILATDGDFNIGPSSDGELVRLIEDKRDDGIFLTVLGLGTGNYKDSKMEQLANKGNGNYAYLDSILEAKKALVTEMGGTLVTIAKDVKLQIEFNPGAVKAYRLLGYENRLLNAEDFNDDQKDAGELGAGHSVTALYELIPADSDEPVPGVDPLQYQQTSVVPSDDLLTLKLRYKQPDGDTSKLLQTSLERNVNTSDNGSEPSDNLQFASAIAEFGLLLRDSQYKGDASYARVLERAEQSQGADLHGYRSEFLTLVEQASLLSR